MEHVGLDLGVDFEQEILSGTATLAIERLDPDAPLVLDTRGLEVQSAQVAQLPEGVEVGSDPIASLGDDVAWTATSFELGDADAILGRPLEVRLPPEADVVRIAYSTTPGASGLQWLTPEQTAGGKAPFLYSQSQAIHARSWIPVQDSPGVRVTYDARIRTSAPLQALMSAERRPTQDEGSFEFSMPQPVPAYLIALAVGALEFEKIGPRTGVWAEPSVLPEAVYEFADVEKMLGAVEALYGPYRWDRYDILVLPPAFPFGGMENPRLTFATPTILAGDRSLVALIAHELAHSWSGNLVTNATWSDLWLNEGFTVYIERRIVEELYGEPRAQMEAVLGRQDLDDTIEALQDEDEKLHPDLSGRDPDEGLSLVPYEKGALFLMMLEHTYGREVFDPFLQSWFAQHSFTSVTTEQFVGYLRENLIDKHEPLEGQPEPDIAAWIESPGVGPGAPQLHAETFDQVDAAAASFVQGAKPKSLKVQDWTPHHWLRFLRALPADVGSKRLGALDRAFGLTKSKNSEILAQWLELGVERGYRKVDARLEEFLLEVGRRKFLVPLYTALVRADRKDEARAIYTKARPGYHPISQTTLDELLGPKK